MPEFNIKKFSFAELTCNKDGKTSGSGTAGLYSIFVGVTVFGISSIFGLFSKDQTMISYTLTVISQSLVLIGMGSILLGYRKSKENKNDIEPTSDVEETK